MNKKYFNGKYNLIILSNYNSTEVPNNVIVREGTLEDIAFQIRSEEINKDQIFNGNLIVNSDYSSINFKKVFSLPLDDNWLYTTNFKHDPNPSFCVLEDRLWYCSSFVLWILGNKYRTENTLYGSCRAHRINLKTIDKSYYKKLDLVTKWDLDEVL
tara:strand:- start:2555 stop:3022 length:468 start_codon:yes stop_codon:yes gene_type:complete